MCFICFEFFNISYTFSSYSLTRLSDENFTLRMNSSQELKKSVSMWLQYEPIFLNDHKTIFEKDSVKSKRHVEADLSEEGGHDEERREGGHDPDLEVVPEEEEGQVANHKHGQGGKEHVDHGVTIPTG